MPTPRQIKPRISRTSLNSIPASFATVSVGTPEDSLEEKLKAISYAGFSAIELGFPDLQSFASKFHKKEVKEMIMRIYVQRELRLKSYARNIN